MNSLQRIPLVLCTLAVAALALPVTSFAADHAAAQQAAQNCSRALAEQTGGRLAGHFYVPAQPDPSNVFFTPNELSLTAVNPANHRVVATAVCYYSSSGHVTDLTVYSPSPLVPGLMERGP